MLLAETSSDFVVVSREGCPAAVPQRLKRRADDYETRSIVLPESVS
jgi:hypothetical protein